MCRMPKMQEQFSVQIAGAICRTTGDLCTLTLRHTKKGPRKDGGPFLYGGERVRL